MGVRLFPRCPPRANRHMDLKDIPASISKQLEIVMVEHLDEVLSHALILGEGDTLFQQDDTAFQMSAESKNSEQPSQLI